MMYKEIFKLIIGQENKVQVMFYNHSIGIGKT